MKPDIQRIDRIKGFLDPEEGMRLFDVALEASRLGPCLEIGSYCGKSSIYLGTACKAGNTVLFSVDHHRGSEEQQPGEEYFDPELFDARAYQMDTFPLFRKTIDLFSAGGHGCAAGLSVRNRSPGLGNPPGTGLYRRRPCI